MHRRDRRNRRSRPAGDVTVTKDADTGYLSTGTPEDASGSRAPTLRVLTGRVALVGAVLVTVFVALAGFAGYHQQSGADVDEAEEQQLVRQEEECRHST